MNPGGLVLVAGGAWLAWYGYSKGKTTAAAQVGSLPGDVGQGATAVAHGVGAAATATHHFLQTTPVKVGQPAPHNPAGRETIGGKTYAPTKDKAGKWVWELAPHKAPRKVTKTPPKMPKAHELPAKPKKAVKAKTLPAPAHRSGTGLVAI